MKKEKSPTKKTIKEAKELVGKTVNNWTILEFLYFNNRKHLFCECLCGIRKNVVFNHLVNGRTKSCGCVNKKHSMSKTRFFKLYR